MKYLILFISVLIGCQSRSIKNDLSTIEILDKNTNKVLINTNDTTYGPIIAFDALGETPNSADNDNIIVGLNLTPLLYNSFLYVPVIKKLLKNKINVHVIGGYGLSAVMASLFANSKNINDFEWKIFKLYKKIEEYPAFSGKWQRQIRSFLVDEFLAKKIYELPKVLLIPRIKHNRVVFNMKSRVVDEVMFSLTSRSRSNFFSNPRLDIIANFNKSSSCEKCLNIAFAVDQLNIVDSSGDKLQIYSKILGQVQSNAQYILLKDVDANIDTLYGLEIFYSRYDKSIDDLIENIKNIELNK